MSSQLLSNPTEATPHKFGGLEAFVLDGFKSKLVPAELPPNVSLRVNQLDQQLATPSRKLTGIRFSINPPKADDLRSQYITDDDPTAFLFIPAFVLENSLGSRRPLTDVVTLRSLGIPAQSMLARDIVAGASASQSLKGILNASGEGNARARFSQVYLVSATGVLRDYNEGGSDNNTFIAHRFFPERPYFWPTVDNRPSEIPCLTPFTFCTRPYVDLGGHGIVVTMCRSAGQTANISYTVLCADLRFPRDETQQTITEELRPFSTGSPSVIVCSLGDSTGAQCNRSDSEPGPSAVEASLKAAVGNSRPEDMLGGIYRLDDDEKIVNPNLVHRIVHSIEGAPYLGKMLATIYPITGTSSFALQFP